MPSLRGKGRRFPSICRLRGLRCGGGSFPRSGSETKALFPWRLIFREERTGNGRSQRKSCRMTGSTPSISSPAKGSRCENWASSSALKGSAEVNLGLSPEEARFSASRCFSCGTCNYCYNCYFFCPEGVISLDPVHQTKTVDLEHCKGCGTCAKACPRSVVEMKEVP